MSNKTIKLDKCLLNNHRLNFLSNNTFNYKIGRILKGNLKHLKVYPKDSINILNS